MKRDGLAAMLLILMAIIFGVAWLVLDMTAEAETPNRHLPDGLPWATVTHTAATHDGPGLRYAMNGTITAGRAVEVLRREDGWSLCQTWTRTEPVWISDENLDAES